MSLGRICAQYSCNHYQHETSSKSFFRFPKEKTICDKWVEFCRRADLDVVYKDRGPMYMYKAYRLCSDHFKDSDFRNPRVISRGLIPDSIPTQNMLGKFVSLPVRRNRFKRQRSEETNITADSESIKFRPQVSLMKDPYMNITESGFTYQENPLPSIEMKTDPQNLEIRIKKEPEEQYDSECNFSVDLNGHEQIDIKHEMEFTCKNENISEYVRYKIKEEVQEIDALESTSVNEEAYRDIKYETEPVFVPGSPTNIKSEVKERQSVDKLLQQYFKKSEEEQPMSRRDEKFRRIKMTAV